MSKRPLLPVGTDCLFYIGAEAKPEHCCAATCIKDNGESVNLIVHPVQGGMSRLVRNVRHVTDPWHKNNPLVSQQCGSWDYVDGSPSPFLVDTLLEKIDELTKRVDALTSKSDKKLQTAS